jgi:hypothetical protein
VAGAPRDASLRVQQVQALPEDAPDVAAMLTPAVSTWSPRSAAMHQWRYLERPDCRYEVRHVAKAGAAVAIVVTRRMTIKGLRTLVVCDAWCSERGPAAVRLAVDDALESGERVRLAIAFGGNASALYRQALRGAGFVVCPPAIQPQPVAIIGGGVGGQGCRVEMPDVAAWHLTPYDWDVF